MPPKHIPARGRGQQGEKSASWKGGRVVASNGYVLIMVGKDHPLADVRGYAYEHRVVAEQKIGRPLRMNDQIHHVNGIKSDNRPDNLEVCEGRAEHAVFHRIREDLQLPDELNYEVACSCGCGQRFLYYDQCGRPRHYISGHNPPSRPAQDAVLATFDGNAERRIADIVHVSGVKYKVVIWCLLKLREQGFVERVRWGVWRRMEIE
jgi:hypothetical protein